MRGCLLLPLILVSNLAHLVLQASLVHHLGAVLFLHHRLPFVDRASANDADTYLPLVNKHSRLHCYSSVTVMVPVNGMNVV